MINEKIREMKYLNLHVTGRVNTHVYIQKIL